MFLIRPDKGIRRLEGAATSFRIISIIPPQGYFSRALKTTSHRTQPLHQEIKHSRLSGAMEINKTNSEKMNSFLPPLVHYHTAIILPLYLYHQDSFQRDTLSNSEATTSLHLDNMA